jgi:5-methylcytosine-specific restriction endonuclease McrA
MKQCPDCLVIAPSERFPRGRGKCRDCVNGRQRAYNAAHRDAVHKSHKKAYQKRKIAALTEARAWKAANPEKVKAIQKRANAKRYSVTRDRLLASPELRAKARAAVKNWYGRNKDRSAVYYHRRRARLAGVENSYTQAQWRACQVYFNHCCAYCLRPLPLEMEHMTPISRDGPHIDENIVPACEPCNLRKHASTLLEFAARGM